MALLKGHILDLLRNLFNFIFFQFEQLILNDSKSLSEAACQTRMTQTGLEAHFISQEDANRLNAQPNLAFMQTQQARGQIILLLQEWEIRRN